MHAGSCALTLLGQPLPQEQQLVMRIPRHILDVLQPGLVQQVPAEGTLHTAGGHPVGGTAGCWTGAYGTGKVMLCRCMVRPGVWLCMDSVDAPWAPTLTLH